MECGAGICHPRKRAAINIPSQYDAVRDDRQHVQSRILLILPFSVKSRGYEWFHLLESSLQRDILNGTTESGSIHRQATRSSPEGEGPSGRREIKDHVSTLIIIKLTMEKTIKEFKKKLNLWAISIATFIFDLYFSLFATFQKY